MEDTNLGKSLDNGKEELEKHLPDWFLLLRRLVAEQLNKQDNHKTLLEAAGTQELEEGAAHG